ncbi:MAG TPA: PEGA domain-containing protein [Polyangia bacterium]|nr:PEGA domain-containing protein [Polyangia bacterium]
MLFAITAAVGTTARAADSVEAEALIREGISLRRSGNDARALPLFQKANEIARTPRTAAQLGLVEFALGYAIDAEHHLEQGLAAPTDPWIGKNRKVLDEALAGVKMMIGELTITGSPEGAEVTVNTRPVGRLPLPAAVRLGQGQAIVELKATGFLPRTTTVEILGGKPVIVDMPLAPDPAKVARAAAPSTVALNPIVGDQLADNAGAGRSVSTRTVVGWAMIAAGAAALVAGGVWLLRSGEPCNTMPGFECASTAPNRTGGWILFGAGAATALGGGIVLLTRPRTEVAAAIGLDSILLRSSF